MRILLVGPRLEYPMVTGGWYVRPDWLRIPQMSLLVLKALSGDEHQVVIVEEEWDPFPPLEKWDLVGITVMTSTAPRAYKLSQMFRERGAKVVLGGIHASVLPEEAGRYADAVVVGEAEGLWGHVLDDAERQSLKPLYYKEQAEEIQVPLVNYQRSKKSHAPTLSPVVASRGCPYRCDFCSVPRVYGNRVRRVPVSQVVEQVKHANDGYLAFLDDNLTGNRNYAFELFEALQKLKVKFIAQVPVRFILDEEMFQTAVRAGLRGILVGFESIEESSLGRLPKSVAVDTAGIAIRRCRAAGVLLHGSFIFGMDEHDKASFGRTLDFVMEHKIPSASAHILTPYPGTPIFDRIAAEGRLLHRHWAFYDHVTPVFHPSHMTIEELAEGFIKFRTSLYSVRGIAHRLLAGISPNFYAGLQLNIAFRRTTHWLKKHYHSYFTWLRNARKTFSASDFSASSEPLLENRHFDI
jgi:radical SAM superfamily enzyme YgiQ (UPF0313 family)